MLSSPPSPIRVPLSISTVTNAFVKLRRSTSKAETIDSTSGEPQTHPLLQGEGATSKRKVPLVQSDLFSCRDAVDVKKLLRGSRASLLERAEFMGANVLVDESWECSIRVPRDKRQGYFKVQIRYCASASRSSLSDPQKPVALDRVQNVSGLMTIVDREELSP
ncbi:uncharacterized protein EDB91DRAFT_1214802 [Suillus paluster]|uniref:uncharacterized protein n=1 Tax=Suillus paluster TaxID=48578 RepID=UPI001B883C58|nr:uncharacterized protein EDB91DRAFT_1214802 [Suillus paluster]KAG1753536.1 hypothetical protein EDB91DRAFT_1214802 [Suillus paluster]